MELTYVHPHKLSFLHDEILAAVPEVAPVDGQAVMLIQGNGETVTITVPDDLPESVVAAITAVVETHDPLMESMHTPPIACGDAKGQLIAQAEAIAALYEQVTAQQSEIETLQAQVAALQQP